MSPYKRAYMQYMDSQGVKYLDKDEHVVRVSYSGDNLNTIPVYVFFDQDGDGIVTLRCWDIVKIPEDKMAKALITCNEMNKRFRWVKFYVDKDRDIMAEMDAVVDMQTVGAECVQLVKRTVNIIDDAYPEFMRVVWG